MKSVGAFAADGDASAVVCVGVGGVETAGIGRPVAFIS
jgi:hypothetical protein